MESAEAEVKAKDYLVRMDVWDPDRYICSLNIANRITREQDPKWGRRMIEAFGDVQWNPLKPR